MLPYQKHQCQSKEKPLPPLPPTCSTNETKDTENGVLWRPPNDQLHVLLETRLTECWCGAACTTSQRSPVCLNGFHRWAHHVNTTTRPETWKVGKTRKAPQGCTMDPGGHPFLWESEHFIRIQQEWVQLSLSLPEKKKKKIQNVLSETPVGLGNSSNN